MDPDPLRLLEAAHPLRFGSISQGPPKPRFRIRPNCRLKRPPKLVNKTVNNFIKIVDGPTQMSRSQFRLNIVALLVPNIPFRRSLTLNRSGSLTLPNQKFSSTGKGDFDVLMRELGWNVMGKRKRVRLRLGNEKELG